MAQHPVTNPPTGAAAGGGRIRAALKCAFPYTIPIFAGACNLRQKYPADGLFAMSCVAVCKAPCRYAFCTLIRLVTHLSPYLRDVYKRQPISLGVSFLFHKFILSRKTKNRQPSPC